MISIIIPCYNHAKELKKCLESITKQTYKNYEIIVVDDGSDDDPELEVRSSEFGVNSQHKTPNTKLSFFRQEHKGAPAARNLGFKHSKGEYVIFCDADLQMEPTMLEEMLKKLEGTKLEELGTRIGYIYSSFRFGRKVFSSFPYDVDRLRKMPYIHTSALIRRECFPGFDEALTKFQDWDLFLTMAEKGYYGVWIPKVLYSLTPREKGKGISNWLPSFAYKVPWKRFGIRIPEVERYNEAMEVIKKKHNLNF
jgi:glycosyltransferase involved in cell wall biosynthesis